MFWEVFTSLCAKEGQSANAIAKKLSISSGSITNWKNGIIPSNTILKKISSYFNVSVDYLLGKTESSSITITEQEKILLETFRSTTEFGRQRIIQSALNIYDEIEKKDSEKNTRNSG